MLSYWNVFEDGDVGAADYGEGYRSWSDEVTRDANATICQAADLGGATCVDCTSRSRASTAHVTRPGCWPTTGTTPTPPGQR